MALMRVGILLNVVITTFAAFNTAQGVLLSPVSRFGKEQSKAGLAVSWNNGAFDLVYQSQEGGELIGRLGSGSIPSEWGAPDSCDSGAGFCWDFSSQASLRFLPAFGGKCYSVEWQTEFDTLGDCFQLDPAHWYGGAEVFEQSWPIDFDSAQAGGDEVDMAYVTGDFLHTRLAGVMEPYWINSDGFGIRALRENALFVAWNSSGSGQICLNARYAYPYPLKGSQETRLSLRYLLCSAKDVKEMQLLSLSSDFWAKPRDVVDERMLTHPIWSTWARYKTLINQERVGAFAQQIRQYGFNDSQLEIDDRWEDCYGEHRFDTNKFPDPGAMVADLHDQGFRVTLWIHPFINAECPSFTLASEHVVRTTSGQPGLTNWWQGNSAGYFDFTRQSAADWWSSRITKLSTDYGLDGFKIDAGETNWLPVDFDFTGLLLANSTPNGYSTAYARNMERFGKMTEIRSGWATQDVPIFTRMLDKGTHWGKENGLATLIPTLLHFSLIGYPFVLPDMIGGNGYDGRPGKELFVRWMQANVFMPTMQFSYTPWDYDDEVVLIAQKMTGLHYEYAPLIVSLANQATVDGTPINRPLWWLDPSDPVALAIDSEYLLGDNVLVAPVLEKGAVSRDVYLPVGTWKDEADAAHPTYTGPIWLRDYPAPLDTLPFFTRA